ncbi:hypothetical protein N7450_008301 [Penicillium hetheringtonii]|uniref:Zn(2)-C6 fungal-type domain-containing protein n=1 Tax=Penicillium hetheringtonii TaxID=911720 RepID=A0AAD6DG16_9EURO|nr:hypothetical protein N7450_008301 [Penicillium hetheringtonii]
MPGVPSNKACERCKKRHLKCDETRPHCTRCESAGVKCPGYVQTRKFIDQGASVRRRYAPYQETHAKPGAMVHAGASAGESPQNNQAQSNRTGNSSTLHAAQPGGPSGAQMNWPGFTFEQNEPGARSNAHTQTSQLGLSQNPEIEALQGQFQLLDDLATHSVSNPKQTAGDEISRNLTGSSASPSISAGRKTTSEAAYNQGGIIQSGLERIVSPASASQRSEKEEFHDIFSELMTDTEHEIAFLTRHFAETIGPWLDLSDSGKFFSVYVPIRAIDSPSLKYAAAALAAKQLARVKGAKLSAGGCLFTSPATTEMYPNAAQADWYLKAANYYYMAVSDMNNSASFGYTAVSSSAVLQSPFEIVSQWLQRASENTQDSSNENLSRKTEEMLAAAVLLTFYRLFDADGDQWHAHLHGIRNIFDIIMRTNQPNMTVFSHGVMACFWNLARQDYLGAYFNRLPTHLDPANLSLWRAAGIAFDINDKLHTNINGPRHLSQEDQSTNGLCWLVCKVINFLARSKQSQVAQWTGAPSSKPGGGQETPGGNDYDTNTWLDLSFQFQTWFEGVPETFRPCVRIDHPRDFSASSENARLPFPEVFYSFSTCAAAMQHYHFGRIALLINQPPDVLSAPSTAFDRLQGYREVTKKVEYRCRELCGIALGRPQAGVRVHMIPLLFAIGQCLEGADEHQIVVDLLRGVEADLGWATEYAVTKLEASWNR